MSTDQQAMFAMGFAQAHQWFRKADGLALAVEELEPSVRRFWSECHSKNSVGKLAFALGPNTHTAFFMMIGYAVEVYLKGLYVRKNPEAVRRIAFKGRDAIRKKFNHKISALARKVDIPLDDAEEILLWRLEKSVVWLGRYPFALESDDQLGFQSMPGKAPTLVALTDSDIQPALALLKRLQRLAAAEERS